MIEIRSLSKHFGPKRAVDDVTFSVAQGEVLGFLGPNGAGKSTTMRMLTGFLAPSRGKAVVCGHDVVRDRIAAQRVLGYLPEGAPLYPDMTPLSILRFAAEARELPLARRRARIDEVIDLVDLEGVRHQRIETLSKGFKRRVGLALAILHDPQVLVLDEPTDGLDPNQKREVRDLIRRMSPGKAIVLSTHILEEVEAVCTRAIIIANGKVCFDGTPAALRERSRHHNAVELELGPGAESARAVLTGVDGVREVERLAERDGCQHLLVYPDAGESIAARVIAKTREEGWDVRHVSVDPGRLDEVFREITEGLIRPAGRSGAKAKSESEVTA